MITKVIIPLAGLGTRMFPITKYLPKEMLPIVNIPSINFILNEIIQTSVTHYFFIINHKKTILNNHIQSFFKGYPNLKYTFIEQEELNGLGGAVLLAKPFIENNEHFLLVLPDNIFSKTYNISKGLISFFNNHKTSSVALNIIPDNEIEKRAIISDFEKTNSSEYLIKEITDKPKSSLSKLAISGRYVLSFRIFEFIDDKLSTGEIELTSALGKYCKVHKLLGVKSSSEKFDIGSKKGYYQAFINLG